ncbi:DUF3997 domain-containing protein [Lysinibacillus piscis]|uniref:DUF3997 domain-containing protein n=1 Tax=Lysinibacillus piscis TaxID=2518931 RepID=A0ABQ5NJQ2_9BACI|nr:DUF3997 domain-containing protein [Lysinibacillus sp. KH24]GLC88532.1 hypothetical protein LYSBPC_16590 [Lysinibacillus sp. KH24]
MRYLGYPLLCLILLTGCAGLADYTIPLPNGYRIDRTSAQQISIYSEEPIANEQNYRYTPPKITHIWWNDDFIIAKQAILKSENNCVAVPTEGKYAFWIIDMHAHLVYGPFDKNALAQQKELLGLPQKIKWTAIEDLHQ